MTNMERVGISVEKPLLEAFDKLIGSRGYANRSQAVRDLIRGELSRQRTENKKAEAIAAVCLVYDHHSTELMQKLTVLQHSHLLETICSIHIHLDKHNCMEIIILRGKVGRINKTADNLISLKGVKLGKTQLIAADME